MASLSGVAMALLLVAQKWQPQITIAGHFASAGGNHVAVVLPARLLHLQEFEAFAAHAHHAAG